MMVIIRPILFFSQRIGELKREGIDRMSYALIISKKIFVLQNIHEIYSSVKFARRSPSHGVVRELVRRLSKNHIAGKLGSFGHNVKDTTMHFFNYVFSSVIFSPVSTREPLFLS